jgi:hypothetical protein
MHDKNIHLLHTRTDLGWVIHVVWGNQRSPPSKTHKISNINILTFQGSFNIFLGYSLGHIYTTYSVTYPFDIWGNFVQAQVQMVWTRHSPSPKDPELTGMYTVQASGRGCGYYGSHTFSHRCVLPSWFCYLLYMHKNKHNHMLLVNLDRTNLVHIATSANSLEDSLSYPKIWSKTLT